ncbi:site-specific DNA-methyltransferase [Ilyobacter polytropus]|uniref:Site-specific DNA-methyltransferase (Adenine-specific) n=1 Tax=Ilyobacter polytropus (strain ATCC 51220 / DSM 2926 / LMG 16218 / CuHBu1) TaxID=572544 RepID=E3HBT2_ILYPC|nr:site-specific DNA-methyltransferase [Ilyobacter polytropus]ADO83844.1 Site-specific DNA-methyltransferase (adenine-specific) [Ilyobacter polytropus DSM 2926]
MMSSRSVGRLFGLWRKRRRHRRVVKTYFEQRGEGIGYNGNGIITDRLKEQKVENNKLKIDILKKEFPECFDRDGNFNLEKFQWIISPETKVFKDSYGLNWLGKSYARALAQGEARKMLREDVEHNSKEENRDSENLYIKGDNLEVLKHLDSGYREKIKMIYIDPPYNTKSGEFVYNDNRDFSAKELNKLVRSNIIDEEEKERILKWEGNSSSHSAWLTFMFPRLYLARKLLTEDGVIFISIDDNELAQLKLMCDEIFGEENFIANIAVVNNLKGRSDDEYIATAHENLLIYRKSTSYSTYGIPMPEDYIKEYDLEDCNGKYRLQGLRKRGSNSKREDRPKMFYPIYYNQETKKIYLDENEGSIKIYPKLSDGSDGCWRWGKATAVERIDELEAKYINKRNEFDIYQKDYLIQNGEQRIVKAKSFWLDKSFSSDAGTKSVRELFGTKVFSSPKAVDFISYCLSQGIKDEDIILDFFSGSATTSHAVNKLNLEDGGNRKWIMVQLEEELSQKSEAYKFCEKEKLPKNITSIGIERIKRANKQMLDEEETKNQEDFDRIELEKKLGFKIFGIDNKIKELDEMIEFTDEITLPEHISLTNNDRLDLVHTYKLQDGNFLNTEIETVKLSWEKTVVGGDGSGTYIYEGYRVGEILYLIDSISSSKVQSKIIEKIDNDPEFEINKIVIYGFTNTIGKYRVELEENIKNYNNKKGANIEVEVRY